MRLKEASSIMRDIQRSYDKIAKEFAQTRQYLWPEFGFFGKYIDAEMTILDAGCGNGRLYKFLRKFKVDYMGCDFSKNLLKEAREAFPEGNFVYGDLLKLPFADNSFDMICSIAVLHHFPAELQMRALEQLKRVLKSGGKVILSVWNLNQAKFRKLKDFDFCSQNRFIPWGIEKKERRYYYAFEAEDFSDLIKRAGLKIIENFGSQKGKNVDFREAFNFWVVAEKI